MSSFDLCNRENLKVILKTIFLFALLELTWLVLLGSGMEVNLKFLVMTLKIIERSGDMMGKRRL